MSQEQTTNIKKTVKILEDRDHLINNTLKEPFVTKTTTITSSLISANLLSRQNPRFPKTGCLIPITLPRDLTHRKVKIYRSRIPHHIQITSTNKILLMKSKTNQHEFNIPLASSLMVIKMTGWQLIAR